MFVFFSVQQFETLGYTRLLLQIGRGTFEPEAFINPRFRLEFFRYKDSIAEDIRGAALVISHAGVFVCVFCFILFCFCAEEENIYFQEATRIGLEICLNSVRMILESCITVQIARKI